MIITSSIVIWSKLICITQWCRLQARKKIALTLEKCSNRQVWRKRWFQNTQISIIWSKCFLTYKFKVCYWKKYMYILSPMVTTWWDFSSEYTGHCYAIFFIQKLKQTNKKTKNKQTNQREYKKIIIINPK